MISVPYRVAKRTFDVLGASCLLVITAPVQATIAIAVRITHGSPVLFKQDRPGLHGETFTLMKFRTMRVGDMPDEDRLTDFGRLLRSTSIDELPSLINVVKGDLSLVGPRPLLEEYLPLYNERQSTRHDVRPGITGLAQTSGRNLLLWEDRLELDAEYVESASFRLDLSILLTTLRKVVEREGVSAEGHETMTKFAGETA